MGTRGELASLVDAARRDRRPPGDRPRRCRWSEAARGLRRDGRRATCSARSSSPADARGPTCSPAPARASARRSPTRSASAATTLVLLARTSSAPRSSRRRYPGARRPRRRPGRPGRARGALAGADLDRSTRWCTRPASSSSAPVAELDLDDLAARSSTVNLTAPAVLTRALLPALRAARGHGRLRQLRRRPGRPPRVVGVRRLEVRPARAGRLAARRGGRSTACG